MILPRNQATPDPCHAHDEEPNPYESPEPDSEHDLDSSSPFIDSLVAIAILAVILIAILPVMIGIGWVIRFLRGS